MKKCPGLYCGKLLQKDGTYGICGACPRGYQPDDISICIKCKGGPSFYDCLYLGFMALLSLVLHWFFIEFRNRRKRSLVILHLSALTECVLSGLLTLLLVDPVGSLGVRSCPVKRPSDWYTMLHNPTPNYTTTLHCTQEIVYPLYTIVMVYYAFSLVFLMLIRPVISYKFVENKGAKSIYAALYFLPILIVLQAVFGGLLYYAFPYIIIVVSVVTSATHLASCREKTLRGLLQENFTNVRNIIIMAGHWILHAYGIIAMTELEKPSLHAPLLGLVVFPALFYIVTVKFTSPNQLERV